MTWSKRRPKGAIGLALSALAVACVLVLAACGDDDGSGEQTGSSDQTADATTGGGDAASGTPVVIGSLNLEDQPEFNEAVLAAVEYLNQEGGGLLGRPIEVRTCASSQTPQDDIKCANELIGEEVAAVIVGADSSADSAFPLYEQAGVPVITPRVVTNQQLINPVSVALGPGIPGLFAAIADYVVEELDGESVITAAPEGVPEELLDQLIGAPFEAAGVESNYVFFNPENPNFDATFAAAAQQDPDALLINIDQNASCIPAMKALQTLDPEFAVFQVLCTDESVLEAAGPLAEGELFFAPVDSIAGVESPDEQLYQQIMDEYAPDTENGFNSALAVATVMTLSEVLDNQGGKQVSPEAVLSAFKNSEGVDIFMGPPLECGTVKPFPAQCTLALRFFTVEDGEKVAVTDYVSAPQYLEG